MPLPLNQYKTLFEIVNTASAEKRILIFTHNIEMINIIKEIINKYILSIKPLEN